MESMHVTAMAAQHQGELEKHRRQALMQGEQPQNIELQLKLTAGLGRSKWSEAGACWHSRLPSNLRQSRRPCRGCAAWGELACLLHPVSVELAACSLWCHCCISMGCDFSSVHHITGHGLRPW